MKKIFTYLASAALVLAASCNKMEEIDTPIDTPVDTPAETEVITVELNPDTKTALGTEGATIWSKDDEVSVTVNGKNIGSLKLVEGNTFSGEVEAGHIGDAILNYPAGVTAVPTTQVAVPGTFANGAALLEGTTTMENLRAGEGATLQNKTALLEFSVARSGSVIFNIGDKNYTITGCETSNTYYACVDPVENAALSYTVASNQGAKSKSDASFAPGKIYPLGTVTEVFTPQPGYAYLKPNQYWLSDNARFAAYFFSETWVSMTLVDGQIDIYQCAIPEGEMGGILFCRMDPNNAENRWNHDGETSPVWNKTVDLTLTEGCVFTLNDGEWETGTWSGTPAVEKPAITPGKPSEWALVGAFSGWADQNFVTTTDADVVVLEDVAMEAAQGFLVRKPSTEWADKYGAGTVNYLKANCYITTAKEGADMCLEAAGTYDIYFKISTKAIYVMTADTDYATATEQTVSGQEPEQEEPEVTEKKLYLTPNSNWKKDGARFAAYFFGSNPNEVWVSMTDSDGDGIYEVSLPAGYDYGVGTVIFCRMNGGTTANNWNNKWNQTADLNIPNDGTNHYTVKSGTWDKGGGTWSVK